MITLSIRSLRPVGFNKDYRQHKWFINYPHKRPKKKRLFKKCMKYEHFNEDTFDWWFDPRYDDDTGWNNLPRWRRVYRLAMYDCHNNKMIAGDKYYG